MTQHLADMRILIADDQTDVARTLCRPLQKAGARLRFVQDGQTALREITTRPFDLVLIDMKMPPEEWGGLWLLRQLKDGGWRISSLVLSGEGAKQQVIEALRLDAADWVVKDDAGEELLERCTTTLAGRLGTSLKIATHQLPTPLAHRFARYARTTDPDKKVREGFYTLESVLRFAAALGFSSTPPVPLKGVTPNHLAAPSLGSWFALCAALAALPDAGDDFARMFSWLVPEPSSHPSIQSLIKARNALEHDGVTPTLAQADQLDSLLRRFAHRACASRCGDLAVPISMVYDGTTYTIEILSLRGVGKPVPDKVMTQEAVITGQPYLVPRDAAPLPLAPWLLAHTESNSGTVRCLQFNGLHRTKGRPTAHTSFKYAKTDEGEDVPTANHPQAEWQTLAQWTTA